MSTSVTLRGLVLIFAAQALLSSCGGIGARPDGRAQYDRIVAQVTAIRPPRLADLPRTSSREMFGPMHRDPEYVAYRCEYALNPDGSPCDVSAKMASVELGADETIRSLAYNLNFARSRSIDPSLTDAGLDTHFRYASGEMGNSVRVFGATPSGISFLVEYPWGTMAEIKAAAGTFCGRNQRDARFVGASQACMPPRSTKVSMDLNGVSAKEGRATTREQGSGKDKVWETWLLVAFDCADRTAAR